MTKEEYIEKAKYIWQNLVPKQGQAESEQGELLRAIEKLRDEAHRNGNGNFNDKCHVLLIDFLRERLIDKTVFEENTLVQINTDLDRLSLANQPYLDHDIFDRIAYRIVDWYMVNNDPIPHQPNEALTC